MCILGIKIGDSSSTTYIKPQHGFIEECDATNWGWGSKYGDSYQIHHRMWETFGSGYGGPRCQHSCRFT